MKIETRINPHYNILKSYINEDYERTSVKEDVIKGHGLLMPTVNPYLTNYILENTSKVNICCEVLSEDLCLQEYLFRPLIEETDVTVLEKFWNKQNKYQFKLASQEYLAYGYGCCEIIQNENKEVVALAQFPAKTTRIRKSSNSEGKPVYYAVQLATATNGGEKKFRLIDCIDKYDDKDNDLPLCLWIGGDNNNEFYSTPAWYSQHSRLLGKINLDLLNAETINNGNQISGVLIFSGSPQRPNEDGLTPEEYIRQKLQGAGTGNFVTWLETFDPDISLNAEYIKISNDNWDYLEKFSNAVDTDTLSTFRVPKTRLMDNAETESMNSHKTDSIWEIYTISLNYRQLPLEMIIQYFNRQFFGIDAEVEMDTPIFTDKLETNINITRDLFRDGLLTLGQACRRLETYLTDIDFTNIDYDAPYMNERFLNGKIMGLSESESNLDNELERILGLL